MTFMRILVKIIIVGVLICLACVCLEAQQFDLKMHSEVKTLDYNKDWFVVQRIGSEDECCNSRRLLGEIVEFSLDSMQLKVVQFETVRTDSEKSYHSKVKFNTKKEFPIYTIAKSDIKNIQEQKSKLKRVFNITGGVLLFTSVATAIHALIVDDDDRKALFLSSGIQLGASIALISFGSSKNKKYSIGENAWRF